MLKEERTMLNSELFFKEFGDYNSRKDLASDQKFKATNQMWNRKRLNAAYRVGCISELLAIFKPKTYQEWIESYIAWSYDQHKIEKLDCYDCLFLYQAKTLSNLFNLSLKTAMQYCIYRILDQSWNGYLKEVKAVKEIQTILNNLSTNKKYLVRHSNWNIDKNFAIDAEVFLIDEATKKEKLVLGIQLKPESFTRAYKYTTWGKAAMKQNLEKQLKYVNEKHVKTCFWTYEQIAKKQAGAYSDFNLIKTL